MAMKHFISIILALSCLLYVRKVGAKYRLLVKIEGSDGNEKPIGESGGPFGPVLPITEKQIKVDLGGCRRAMWGCFDENSFVDVIYPFRTSQPKRVRVGTLKKGDKVKTYKLSRSLMNEKSIFTVAPEVTTVKRVDIFNVGNWKARTIKFPPRYEIPPITVTSNHKFPVKRGENVRIVRAGKIRMEDKLFSMGKPDEKGGKHLLGKHLIPIANIENHIIRKKISVETMEGTIEMNHILACAYPAWERTGKQIIIFLHIIPQTVQGLFFKDFFMFQFNLFLSIQIQQPTKQNDSTDVCHPEAKYLSERFKFKN